MRNEIVEIDEISLEQALFDVEIANLRIIELMQCMAASTAELALVRGSLAKKKKLQQIPPRSKSRFSSMRIIEFYWRRNPRQDAVWEPIAENYDQHATSGSKNRNSNFLTRQTAVVQVKNMFLSLFRRMRSRTGIKVHIDDICGNAADGRSVIHIHRGSHNSFKLQGWAIPMPALTVFKTIEIALVSGSERVSGLAVIVPRPDLVSHLQNKNILMSGMNWTCKMDDLPAHEYTLQIIGTSTDGTRRQENYGNILIYTESLESVRKVNQ